MHAHFGEGAVQHPRRISIVFAAQWGPLYGSHVLKSAEMLQRRQGLSVHCRLCSPRASSRLITVPEAVLKISADPAFLVTNTFHNVVACNEVRQFPERSPAHNSSIQTLAVLLLTGVAVKLFEILQPGVERRSS